MIRDVVSTDGGDLGVEASEAPRAANVLRVQQGSLEYAPDFGVDLALFITSPYKFQNASFKAYLIERLLRHQVNVVSVIDTVERLFAIYNIEVGSTDNEGAFQ